MLAMFARELDGNLGCELRVMDMERGVEVLICDVSAFMAGGSKLLPSHH